MDTQVEVKILEAERLADEQWELAIAQYGRVPREAGSGVFARARIGIGLNHEAQAGILAMIDSGDRRDVGARSVPSTLPNLYSREGRRREQGSPSNVASACGLPSRSLGRLPAFSGLDSRNRSLDQETERRARNIPSRRAMPSLQ